MNVPDNAAIQRAVDRVLDVERVRTPKPSRFYVQVLSLADGGQVYGIWDTRRNRLAWRDREGSTWVAAGLEVAERQAAQWNLEAEYPPPPRDYTRDPEDDDPDPDMTRRMWDGH